MNPELKNKINERNNDDLIFLNKLIVRAFFKRWNKFSNLSNNIKNPLIKTDIIYIIPYKNTRNYIDYRRRFIHNKTITMKKHTFNCSNCSKNVNTIVKIEQDQLILYKKTHCRDCYKSYSQYTIY